ncbi:MAG TPA: hypothetical protein VET23_06475 [Chitinophagaceae bacterium]|nr:hypothetical protein [Chitinophagaceae bacterium]
MKDPELKTFSWPLLFIVTGICFLIFSGFLKLTNEERSGLFFLIGSCSLAAGVTVFIFQSRIKKETDAYSQKEAGEE